MLKTVDIIHVTMEPSKAVTYQVESVLHLLTEQFDEMRPGIKVYHKYVSLETDVTPSNVEEAVALDELDGPFVIMVHPAGGIAIGLAILAVVLVAAVVLMPKAPPIAAMRNTQQSSANNELSERTNKARPNSRVEDIYGQVRSTPTLMGLPYRIFENNEEVEYMYACVGRGDYLIEDVRDDTTLIDDIAGASVEVFAPFTSPNSGDEPKLRIGAPINTRILNVGRSNSVNGQVLRAPNDENVKGTDNIKFNSTGRITIPTDYPLDFTDKFAAGDLLKIENAARYASYHQEVRTITANADGSFQFQIDSPTSIPPKYEIGKEVTLTGAVFVKEPDSTLPNNQYDVSGMYEIASLEVISETGDLGLEYFYKVGLQTPNLVNPQWNEANGLVSNPVGIRIPDGALLYDLAGEYTILSVVAKQILLDNPVTVNPDWGTITETPYYSPILSTSGVKPVGPFLVEKRNVSQLFNNIVALNGLYKRDARGNQFALTIELQLEVTPIDEDGTYGEPVLNTFSIDGSATFTRQRGVTNKFELPNVGNCSVRMWRLTEINLDDDTGESIVDEVQWRDLYEVSEVDQLHFGDKTTVQAVTYATAGALQVKERKLNMLATRLLQKWVSGTTFTTQTYATKDAADIICAICIDPKIGARPLAEVDFAQIHATINEVKQYFGTPLAAEFCYTFDKAGMSFQEMIKMVADAVFCIAYRRGSVIRLQFERKTDKSVLLFNHRNKVPKSEQRTKSFGNNADNDGVELKWIDPYDDAMVTFYVPENRSALNPKSDETVGVRNNVQAYLHAKRRYNRIKYQRKAIEFKALEEADLLIEGDRILVADNTRTGTQDGQVRKQVGLDIELSQPVDFTKSPSYSVYLQMYDGSVEMIPVVSKLNERTIRLSRAPRLPLVTDFDAVSKTKYMLVGDNDARQNAFIVTDRVPQSNSVSTVKAINYDDRYYQNDKDFINGLISA